MARHFLRRYLPHPDALKQHRVLRIFSHWLQRPDLWHLNRRSASTGIAIGLFWAFMPIPLQMIPSTATALTCRANVPLAIVGVWITNPFTVPPLFFMCYQLGAWVLGVPVLPLKFDPSWTWLVDVLSQIWKPFLLGCFLTGASSAIAGYFGVRALWRWQVIAAWEKRKEKNVKRSRH
jgi:uncharacterized protein (DUF2062 family)